MKKQSFSSLVTFFIFIVSIAPNKQSFTAKKEENPLVQKVIQKPLCGTSFNVNVSCSIGSPSIQLATVYITGVNSWDPVASCGFSGYIGTSAFIPGYYQVSLYLSKSDPSADLSNLYGSITSPTAGEPATFTSSSLDDNLIIHLPNVYLIGCGENYTINISI